MKTNSILSWFAVFVFIFQSFFCEQFKYNSYQTAPHPWCQQDFQFSKDNPLLLTSRGLGPLKESITKSKFLTICPTTRDTLWFDGEGNVLEGTTLTFGTSTVGLVEWIGETPRKILITDPRIITDVGINVGSEIRKIRQVWGELTAGVDHDGVYLWSERVHNISYVVDVNIFELLTVPDDVAKNPDVIPDTSIVKKIIYIFDIEDQ